MEINVNRTGDSDPLEFHVQVADKRGNSEHEVTLKEETYEELKGSSESPEELIKAAFQFLLDREPKEAILHSFDVDVISRYFPEFPRRLPEYLGKMVQNEGGPEKTPKDETSKH